MHSVPSTPTPRHSSAPAALYAAIAQWPPFKLRRLAIKGMAWPYFEMRVGASPWRQVPHYRFRSQQYWRRLAARWTLRMPPKLSRREFDKFHNQVLATCEEWPWGAEVSKSYESEKTRSAVLAPRVIDGNGSMYNLKPRYKDPIPWKSIQPTTAPLKIN